MKATAVAPANIAFIKYWGKRADALRLPVNSSISMNLSGAYTTTTVEFSKEFSTDSIASTNGRFSEKEEARIINHLHRLRHQAQSALKARVVTRNSFPKSVGLASSASGFAALTFAAATALELTLSEKELSILARLGSGSACRSIPNGFVLWEEGSSSQTSYAYSIFPARWWDLRDIVVVVQSKPKEVSSASGMETAWTSPLYAKRLTAIPGRIEKIKDALAKKDIHLFGEVIEEDCLDMHAVMQSQNPPLHYLTEETRRLMDAVRQWRQDSIAVYFTIDAGPNAHLICEGKDEREVTRRVRTMQGVEHVMVNKPARGAHLITDHLF